MTFVKWILFGVVEVRCLSLFTTRISASPPILASPLTAAGSSPGARAFTSTLSSPLSLAEQLFRGVMWMGVVKLGEGVGDLKR